MTTTWLLLRGLTREAAHWGGFPELLRRTLPGARVLTLDLPGNGLRHDEPSPRSIGAMVADVRAELVRLGQAGPCHVLAMSLGAMVAAEWAAQAPGDLAGCVLVNTSLRPFSPFYRRLRPRNYPALARLALGQRDALARETAILRLTSHDAAAHHGVLAAWIGARERHPVQSANALRQLWAAMRYRAPRQAPAVPLLLLASARDGLVHASCSRAIARRWDASLALHPWAGHDLPLDDPAWVARQVGLWATNQLVA